VVGTVLGLIAVFVRQSYRKMKQSPEGSRKLEQIRAAL
jgi:hypothetical protein